MRYAVRAIYSMITQCFGRVQLSLAVFWCSHVWYAAVTVELCSGPMSAGQASFRVVLVRHGLVLCDSGEVKWHPMTFGYGRAKQAGVPFSVGYVLFSIARVEYRVVSTRAVSVRLRSTEQCIGGVLCGSVQFR